MRGATISQNHGVITLVGYGIHVRVDRGRRLIIEEGNRL